MNNRELYGLCTGSGSYGNNGSFFSRAWNWLANSTVGQWVGGLFGSDSSEKPATPDNSPNASAGMHSGDSSGGNYGNGSPAGYENSLGGYSGSSGSSGSSGNLKPNKQAFADLYNAPGNIGYDNLIGSYGKNWSGDHGYIDDDEVGVLPGFAGDYSSNGSYDAIGAYQTEQAINGNGFALTQQEVARFNELNGSFRLQMKISVPAGSNGVIIQKVRRRYKVVDSNGNPVQSKDAKVNGATSTTYYEAWEVNNGQIGITLDGQFNIADSDTFIFAGWNNDVANGWEQIDATMVFIQNATITGEYQWATNPRNSWSGDLPYTTPNAPQAWNASGGVIRRVTVTYDPNTQMWSHNMRVGHHP